MPAYKYILKGNKVRWYANFYYTDWTGKKKHVCKRGFKTQREAKEYELRFVEQKTNTDCDILFGDLVKAYLDDMAYRLKPTTMETKQHIINEKIMPYFRLLKVCDISTITVRKWQNEILSMRDKNGNYYSNTYLKTIHNQLSTILNYAVAHYNLPSNPCRVAGSIGSKRADEMSIWTQEEYERFAATIKKTAVKLAFDILFFTGMRIGELLALTPADITPDKRINISKNYTRIHGEELFLTPKTPKSKRSISIPDFLYDEIMTYLGMLYKPDPDDRLFYFTKSLMETEIKRGAEKAGLKKIRLHDLRHSHASLLINMGFAPLEISERLGHESVKTTLDTYSHLYPDKDIQLSKALNKLRSE